MKLKFLFFFLLIASVGYLTGCNRNVQKKQPAPQAKAVSVAKPIERTIALSDTFVGRFAPIEEVELRPRVSGYLESTHFTEGKKVEKDELMFKIDPRLFDAAAAKVEAQFKQAKAKLSLAKSNLVRAEVLIKDNAIAREEFDIRRSEVDQAEADVLAAEAGLLSAKLDREFADVRAPISGIAGQFAVTPGNFVNGGNAAATLLTTIVPHDPIYCYFEVDEHKVLQFTRMFFEGKTTGREGEGPDVEIAVADNEEFEFKGKLNFAENRLDRSTATMRMRVRVANENEFLTPGLFGRLRVPFGTPFEARLVRDSALGFDQSKRFAWVLKPDDTVARRFVKIGRLHGQMRVVESGLKSDDRIVVSGFQMLREGTPVKPVEVPMDPNELASSPTKDEKR